MSHVIELSHDIVESILEILPVKSLFRFKSVSIQWKSTIESPSFQKRQLIRRESQDPDILMINPHELVAVNGSRYATIFKDENVTRMFRMASSDLIKLPNFCPSSKPITFNNYVENYTYLITGCCDGMICYYNSYNCIYVVNPITRWSRSIPQARYQTVFLDVLDQDRWKGEEGFKKYWNLGFGKDKFTDTYKLVWLYNSFELSLDNATTCEVFDFCTNSWRYVTAAPYRVVDNKIPVFLDGSLNWFTDDTIEEIKVLSFDLHTETFQIISKPPFADSPYDGIYMCNLDNQLCVSQKKWPTQEIWSLNNFNMTWEKIYSLNLQTDSNYFSKFLHAIEIPYAVRCVIPLAALKKKKSLVLFDALGRNPDLVIYDPELRSYDLCFTRDYHVHPLTMAVSFIPSLISIV